MALRKRGKRKKPTFCRTHSPVVGLPPIARRMLIESGTTRRMIVMSDINENFQLTKRVLRKSSILRLPIAR